MPAEANPTQREVRFEYTAEFPRVLEQLHSTLLISTYQAGKLCVVGVQDGRLTFSFHNVERVMGVTASPVRVAVGARRQIHSFYPAHDVASRLAPSSTCRGSRYLGMPKRIMPPATGPASRMVTA